MKRRTEHLVEKRDGRTEYLRATKLARSIHLALVSVGVDEDWRALELANVVLLALRQQKEAVAPPRGKRVQGAGAVATMLTTTEIAEAAQHLLVVTGQPSAAVAYGAMSAERSRRRGSLALLGRASLPAATAGVGADAGRDRQPRPRAE